MKKTFKSITAIFMIVLTLFSCCSVVLAADEPEAAVLDVVYDEDGNRVGFKTITVGEKVYYDLYDGVATLDGKEYIDFYKDVLTKEYNGDSALEIWSQVAENVFRIGGTKYGYNMGFENYDDWYDRNLPDTDGNDEENCDINLQEQLAQTAPYEAGELEDCCVRATGLQTYYDLNSVENTMLNQIVDVCGEANDADAFKENVIKYCTAEKGFELFDDTSAQPVLAHIVSNQYDCWDTTRYFSSFGIAFYDFELTPIVEEGLKYISAADNYESLLEASENKVPGVSYVVDNSSAGVNYIQNPTSISASASVSASKSVTNSLSTSFSESDSHTFSKALSIGTEITPIKDFFKFSVGVNFSTSDAFSTAFSEGTSVSETISTSSSASVTLPPYTEIGITQTTSSVEQEFMYECPVYVTYKVAIFGLNGYYAQDSGGGGWKSGPYAQGSIFVNFGCDEVMGGISATENLYKRFNAKSPSFESVYGNVSGAYVYHKGGNHDHELIKYIDWASSEANSDLKNWVDKAKNNIPMSSMGGTMNIKTDTFGTELTQIYPMYDLERVRFEGDGTYNLAIGGSLDLNTVNVVGLNKFDHPYYGFRATMGSWHLCDKNGNDLPAYEAGKGISVTAAPTTQLITAYELGDYYLRFDIDEEYYTKAVDRKTYITNDDLEMTAIMKVSVTDTGNNHTCRPGGWITYIPANCVVDGERYRNCLTCSKRLATEVIPKADHVPVEVVTSATCTTDGSKTTTCLTCKAIISNEVIPAKGHGKTYSVTTVTPTCTRDGEKALYCLDCNKLIGSETIASTGHDNGVWKVDFEATPEHEGQMTKYCSTCNYALESKTFAYHTHSYTTWGTNGNGTHTRSCYLCSFTETANCDYDETVTPATCTADGKTTYQCKACKHKYSETSSYAKGHSWGTWTASEDGNHSASCTVCGESENSPHIFVEYIPNNDATKDADGTKTATCVVCAAKDTVIDEGSKLVDTPEDPDDSCSHICHSTGISSFFWKIIRIFWKLFRMNPVCECGAAHY